jgi:phosphate transport system protein
MGTAKNQRPANEFNRLTELTLRGYQAAMAAAADCASILEKTAPDLAEAVKGREEELDALDRDINEGVTTAITQCNSELEVRGLLACLKLTLELERIGDLLLSFSNRACSVLGRIEEADARDLSAMARLLEKMLGDASQAFQSRNADLALTVLRSDAEVDRLRNLLFVRHIENPEGAPRQESFHVVFMSQALERAGDHAKNLAEEVVHLTTGRSVRHLLRKQDKPDEVRFVEFMRQKNR